MLNIKREKRVQVGLSWERDGGRVARMKERWFVFCEKLSGRFRNPLFRITNGFTFGSASDLVSGGIQDLLKAFMVTMTFTPDQAP